MSLFHRLIIGLGAYKRAARSCETQLVRPAIPIRVFTFCRTMNRPFFRPQDRIYPLELFFLSFCLFTFLPARATDFLINGTTLLNAITVPNTGTHHIRFTGAGYQNPVSLTLKSNNSDSIIFERAEESVDVIEFTGTLFQMKNVQATVVFRNLAFKAKNGATIFLEGISASPNRNLLLDSCQIFGDTLNSTFLSWLGGTGSKVQISRSILSTLKGTDAKVDLSADSVLISNTYLNFAGLITSTTPRSFALKNISSNRVQYKLAGDFTGIYSFVKNVFGHPGGQNKLPGNPDKFIMTLSDFAGGGSAQANVRFNSWTGFDFPASASFQHPTNSSVSPFGDTTALWDFRQPSDSLRGYQNPAGSFPAYNIFPGDTALSVRLSGRDSVVASFASAQIPRVVSMGYGNAVYPAAADSTRTFWLQDTTLQTTGPVALKSLRFPQGAPSGLPILFSQSGSGFVPGALGPEGGLSFVNGTLSSKTFIPAFAGQNTLKGSNVSVKGLTSDTALLFSTITRTGRTFFQTTALAPSNKRWRFLQKSGKTLGFKDTTNAEGAGEVRFGFGQTGTDKPFLADSAAWWLGGNSFSALTDSVGKYWGRAAIASSNQAILLERLAVGRGNDTVTLSQGKIVTSSAVGHQLKIDSTSQPDQAQFPDMGSFSKGISFTWLGRGTGDSFVLSLNKSNKLQQAYMKNGATTTLLTPTREDSASVTLSFGLGDSGKVIFLADSIKDGTGVLPNSQAQEKILPLPSFLRVAGRNLPWGEHAVSGHLVLANMQGRRLADEIVPRASSSLTFAPRLYQPLYGWWLVHTETGQLRKTPLALGNVP